MRRVHSIEEITALLSALGHEPLTVPGQSSDVPLSSTVGPDAVVLARTGEFPWFGVTGGSPARLARQVARRLVARGRPAGVIALDPNARSLAIAIAFNPTPVLELELDRPAPLALAGLQRLAARSEGALAFAARAASALSGEPVGHRFFREFKATLDRLTEGLPTRLRGEDRRGMALLQLTRVLFLYFVQAKGWLGGREQFLSEEVDRCLARRRHLHRDLLRPLFFGTLNRPRHERTRGAAAFGAMPFLNGGLFEPHPLERALGNIPNPLWRDAFDRLFERFRFTVRERHDGSAIAPDMLGRVFEGVMAPDARRRSGTFYTPAPLVTAVLEAALATHVAGRLGCGAGEAERRLAAHDASAADALADLTLLDPAAGSGAFLLGALERLSALAIGRSGIAAARRRVLRQNLFGVDRSAAAVRLSELRLWLAVIADDPEERPDRVEPLPNLDCLIRQGDTLLEPIGTPAGLGPASAPLAETVAALRRTLVGASGSEKRGLLRRLRTAEARAAEASFRAAEEDAEAMVGRCLQAARAEDLFGVRRGVDRELRAELEGARRGLRALRAVRRTLTREREVPWFHYQCHFPDVFLAGGFDLVVGNPPWLRAEQLPPDLRARLGARYRWWRSDRGRGFGHQPDLAVAFLERALELARPGGTIAMLVPAKLMTAGYGAAARHALASTTTLMHLADCTGRPEAAFDATVYPLVLVARRAPPAPSHRVHVTLAPCRTAGSVLQSRLRGGGPWILRGKGASATITRIARAYPPIGERLRCQLGVKTGANHLFLDPPATVEAALVRVGIRGRDLRPFRALPVRRLLWTHGPGGAPLAALPPGAAAHLAPHDRALRSRADFENGPPWTLFRVQAASSIHRVVWADLARRLTAAALTGPRDRDLIPLNSCYVAVAASEPEAERVAAWLNSSWLRALALAGAMPAAGGFHRFTASVVERLPLTSSALHDAELSTLARAGRGGEEVQEALDACVARHLELAARERAALARLLADPGAPGR